MDRGERPGLKRSPFESSPRPDAWRRSLHGVTTRLLVVADTHVHADRLERIPDTVWHHAETADLVLHAGDVVCDELLVELGRRAPVHAVLGNNDVGHVDHLPETVELELEGVRIAMVHDSGARKGRGNRMRRRFPAADLVVFGHSHEPVEVGTEHGQRLFNPGSPTQRRRQPHCSFGLVDVSAGTFTTTVVTLR